MDLTSGDGLADCFSALGPELVAVVNCAAASAPAFCEQNADHAAALNVPHQLLKSLAGLATIPLLIHISTDQVYAGTGTPAAGWSEDCNPQPVNVYGATKLEAERVVQVEALSCREPHACEPYPDAKGTALADLLPSW